LLLNPGQRTSAGAGPLRIWSDVDGTIRWQIPQGRFHAAFKIEEIGCSFETFREEHERTQEGLAHGRLYKHRLFVRRNVDGGTRTYDNGSIITKAAGQFVVRKVVPEEMPLILTEEFGLSAEIVQKIPVGYYEQAGSRPVPLRSAS
jgi:hypothetical protein